MHGLFSTCNTFKIWFELSRVELYRNDPKENKNELELARVRIIESQLYLLKVRFGDF